MRAKGLITCSVLLWIGSVGVCWGASCPVPSGSHPTIQAAVQDPGCTLIELQSQTYVESVTIGRSLSLSGVSSATSMIAGRVEIDGTTTVVSLADLTVDGSDPAVAGCFHEAIDVEGGALMVGNNIVVINADGTACLLFSDGFEDGTTAAWSATVP